MTLLTIYENGVRYYSAPVPNLPEGQEDTVISGNGIRVDSKIYEDGSRFDAIFQEISDEEFSLYKKDPLTFTAKQVF